jgi:phosphohistidine phosphatase SixA
MDIVLVRHAARERAESGIDDGSLSEHGRHQATSLAAALALRGTRPQVYLSSKRPAARETTQVVSSALSVDAIFVELDALTPRGGSGNLDHIAAEIARAGLDLTQYQAIMLVGHEGRLSNLLTELTGSRSRPFGHGEAVCVSGDELFAFWRGRGRIAYCYPTVDYQEEALRTKLHSKMTTATFLGGFVFTALIEILLGSNWSWARAVATFALSLSLCLFFAAVYIYDQLGMPMGFWTDAPRARVWRRVNRRREAAREARWEQIASGARNRQAGEDAADEDAAPFQLDGPLYHLMVNVSRTVFTPAVILAVVGFLALLYETGSGKIRVGGVVALAVGFGYWAFRRPDLGAD